MFLYYYEILTSNVTLNASVRHDVGEANSLQVISDSCPLGLQRSVHCAR
jgi:hypothetical protein